MATFRILLVYGDSQIRNSLSRRIRELGHTVAMETEDGITGLNMVRQIRPDLVLADMCPPHLCGLELAEQVEAERIAPIILIPKKSCAKFANKAHNISGCITADCNTPTLAGTIDVATSRFALLSELSQSVDNLTQKIETRRLMDKAKRALMEYYGWNEPTAHRWLQQRSMNTRKSQREVAEAVLLITDDQSPKKDGRRSDCPPKCPS